MPSPPKQRIRTEEQLARKRAADRVSHKARRDKDKNRMDRLEGEIEGLRSELQSLRSEMQALRSAGSETISSSASIPSVEPPASPLIAHYVEENTQPEHGQRSHSPPLPRTEILQLIQANYTSATMRDRVQSMGAGNQWPLIVICSCGIDHKTKDDCLEYATYRILLRAHVAILNGTPTFTALPRTPTLANLLLQSTDDNPVIATLSNMFKRFEPTTMPVIFGLYILLYRLLRWRLHPEPSWYEDIPVWYRPSSTQEKVPHVISIDYLPWPSLRDFMVLNHLHFLASDHSVSTYVKAVRFAWPKEKEVIIKSSEGSMILHPEFEDCVVDIDNWKMSRAWAESYPELIHLVNVESADDIDMRDS